MKIETTVEAWGFKIIFSHVVSYAAIKKELCTQTQRVSSKSPAGPFTFLWQLLPLLFVSTKTWSKGSNVIALRKLWAASERVTFHQCWRSSRIMPSAKNESFCPTPVNSNTEQISLIKTSKREEKLFIAIGMVGRPSHSPPTFGNTHTYSRQLQTRKPDKTCGIDSGVFLKGAHAESAFFMLSTHLLIRIAMKRFIKVMKKWENWTFTGTHRGHGGTKKQPAGGTA